MNIVEFALKFKDMASGELRQFGMTSRQIFQQSQNYAGQLIQRNQVLGQSYEQIQSRIKQVENTIRTSRVKSEIREARRELEKLQKQANAHQDSIGSVSAKGNGGLLSMSIGKLGLIGTAVSSAMAAGRFVGNSIGAGMERQQIQTSFDVLTGSEQSGQVLTKQLVDLQKNTILGSEVFSNAQTMLGFGFKDTEILENMKMLGDVSMGNADRMKSITLVFSQIRAAGRLTGQDLLQLVNAGFNPLEQMTQRTGKSMAQLRDEMSSGNISFKDVRQAFIDATGEGGKFNNMLETIAETPAGKMAQLSGAWNEFKVNAGQAFMPLATMTMDLANKLLSLAENLITPISDGIQQLIGWVQSLTSETGSFMDYWTVVKDLFVDNILPVIQQLWGFIINIVTKVVEFARTSELLKGIFSLIGGIIGVIANSLGVVIAWIEDLFNKVIMPILEVLESAYRFIMKIPQKTY